MSHRFLSTACLCLTICSVAAAQERITVEDFITCAPLPEGYTVNRQDMRSPEGDVVSHLLAVTKEGTTDKVVVSINNVQRVSHGEKAAMLKAYVNGTAGGYHNRGWMIKLRDPLPAVETIDFSKPVVVTIDVTKQDEPDTTVQVLAVFGRRSYQINVMAADPALFTTLSQWAATIAEAD